MKIEKVNRVSDLRAFTESWDTGGVSSKDAEIIRGPAGNINLTGNPYDPSWNIVKNDCRFELFLEAGIRELVLVIVNQLGLVTYTSCEGHFYIDTNRPPDVRHVGIVPRNLREAASIWKLLNPLCAEANEANEASETNDAIKVSFDVDVLDDQHDSYLAFEISFKPLADWDLYFRHIDECCDHLTDRLKGIPKIGI